MSRRKSPKGRSGAIHSPKDTEEAILVHDPDAMEAFEDKADPEKLERAKKREAARRETKERQFKGKLTTREDVVQILTMYIEQRIVPLAMVVDQIAMEVDRLSTPFYKRWWRAFLYFITRWRWRRAESDAGAVPGVGSESTPGPGSSGQPGTTGPGDRPD